MASVSEISPARATACARAAVFTAEAIAVRFCQTGRIHRNSIDRKRPCGFERYIKKRGDEWETLTRCVERAAG
jgi:hypothetical protein